MLSPSKVLSPFLFAYYYYVLAVVLWMQTFFGGFLTHTAPCVSYPNTGDTLKIPKSAWRIMGYGQLSVYMHFYCYGYDAD